MQGLLQGQGYGSTKLFREGGVSQQWGLPRRVGSRERLGRFL